MPGDDIGRVLQQPVVVKNAETISPDNIYQCTAALDKTQQTNPQWAKPVRLSTETCDKKNLRI